MERRRTGEKHLVFFSISLFSLSPFCILFWLVQLGENGKKYRILLPNKFPFHVKAHRPAWHLFGNAIHYPIPFTIDSNPAILTIICLFTHYIKYTSSSALINGKRLVLNRDFMCLGLILGIGKNTLEIVDKTHHDRCKDYQGNEVWYRHQAVQGICNTPYHF